VAGNGTIAAAGHRTSVGTAHAGTTVTVIRDGNRATVYDPHGHPLGYFHRDPAKDYITRTRPGLTPTVLWLPCGLVGRRFLIGRRGAGIRLLPDIDTGVRPGLCFTTVN
jgi:hypothetical protein